jgi:hypothetical protein
LFAKTIGIRKSVLTIGEVISDVEGNDAAVQNKLMWYYQQTCCTVIKIGITCSLHGEQISQQPIPPKQNNVVLKHKVPPLVKISTNAF